jgi:hypothetical protein
MEILKNLVVVVMTLQAQKDSLLIVLLAVVLCQVVEVMTGLVVTVVVHSLVQR